MQLSLFAENFNQGYNIIVFVVVQYFYFTVHRLSHMFILIFGLFEAFDGDDDACSFLNSLEDFTVCSLTNQVYDFVIVHSYYF